MEAEVAHSTPLDLSDLRAPLVVVPILSWNRVTQKAVRFALTLSPEVQALHIDCEKDNESVRLTWGRYVATPAKEAGRPVPHLVVLRSPYRFVIAPIVDYVLKLERIHPERQIAVLIPELVERHWYHYFLHNQRAELLRALLLAKGSQQIILVNVPWHIAA